MKNITFLLIIIILLSCNSSVKNENKTVLNSELKNSIEQGSKIYQDLCINCHLPNGKGVPKSFPPLANSDFLVNNRQESIKAIKYGLSGEIKVNGDIYNMPMMPLGLSDIEIANVMNYITNSWGNENLEAITAKEVSEIKP